MATKRSRAAATSSQAPGDSDGSPAKGVVGRGDLRGSPRMGTALISGATFASKAVTYYDVNGIAIVEGDIAIGTVKDVERQATAARDAAGRDPNIAFSVVVAGSQFRWPNCQIPYEIDPALPNQNRVTAAIAHWEANTSLRFPLRTAANQAQYPNWLRFTDAGGCWSMVGMQGGQQTISLGAGCSTGNAIHEIGHAVGLWHEQSREDRDMFVTIQWQNIQSGMAAQFNQHITDGDDVGVYDYGSIMHYPRNAFSKNGQDTIVPTDPNAVIGQRNGLSPLDVAGVRAIYPLCGIRPPLKKITDERPPFKKVRDDERFKKIVDDNRFKKIRDDIRTKPPRDPKLPRDPGPIKGALDPMPGGGPGPLINPGTARPFSLATPHHADLGDHYAAAATAGYAAELEQQILDLDAAMADSLAQAAQAQAEASRIQRLRDELSAIHSDTSGNGSGM